MSDDFRVLLVTERYPPQIGGVARASARLGNGLSGRGVVVHVLNVSEGSTPGTTAVSIEDGIRVHRLAPLPSPEETLRLAADTVLRLAAQHAYTHIHGFYVITAGYVATVAAKLAGIPSVLSVRGNDLGRALFQEQAFPWLEWTLRNAGAVGCVSRELAESVSRLSGRGDTRYTPNAVDAEVFQRRKAGPELLTELFSAAVPLILSSPSPSREREGGGRNEGRAEAFPAADPPSPRPRYAQAPLSPGRGAGGEGRSGPRAPAALPPTGEGPQGPAARSASEPILGMVGELRFKKGLHIALEAFRRTCEVTPVRLLLVGDARRSDGEFLRNFLEHHSDLAPRVAHVPHVEDPAELARLYSLMDVFLAPSLWEGMPNAVLEAMACECAVVASDAGGIRDLIDQGRTGFAVSRFQLDQFPEVVAEVVAGGPELWRAVGRAAREFVIRDHGLAGEVDRCVELYRSVVAPVSPS